MKLLMKASESIAFQAKTTLAYSVMGYWRCCNPSPGKPLSGMGFIRAQPSARKAGMLQA